MRYRYQFPLDLCFTIIADTDDEAESRAMEHLNSFTNGFDLPDPNGFEDRLYSYHNIEIEKKQLELLDYSDE